MTYLGKLIPGNFLVEWHVFDPDCSRGFANPKGPKIENSQSRLKLFSISIENLKSWPSEFPTKNRGLVGGALEIFNLLKISRSWIFSIFGPLGKGWFPKGWFWQMFPLPQFPPKSLFLQCCSGRRKLWFLIFLDPKNWNDGTFAKTALLQKPPLHDLSNQFLDPQIYWKVETTLNPKARKSLPVFWLLFPLYARDFFL